MPSAEAPVAFAAADAPATPTPAAATPAATTPAGTSAASCWVLAGSARWSAGAGPARLLRSPRASGVISVGYSLLSSGSPGYSSSYPPSSSSARRRAVRSTAAAIRIDRNSPNASVAAKTRTPVVRIGGATSTGVAVRSVSPE
ncbi:MAG TPA: hypothetical protein VFE65_34670 [Pseudonocardia sp.]|nr:hypothetical protein [Pseudonocardia sp.]